MDFQAFAAHELNALARTLAQAADARVEEATAAAVVAVKAEADAALLQLRSEAAAALARAQAEAAAALTAAEAEAGAALARAQADHEQALVRARADHDAALARVRAEAEAAIAAARSTDADAHASQNAMIERLREQHTELAVENERLSAENAAFAYERADLLARSRPPARGPLLERLATAFTAIAQARTVDAVLAAAAEPLAAEFARVAAFQVQDGALTHVFGHGTGRASLEDLPHAGDPLRGAMAPVFAGGERRGVLYADDAGDRMAEETAAERGQLLDLLRAHCELRIEHLAIEQRSAMELQAYAQMLLDEVEYAYDADCSLGRSEQDRAQRLRENLRYARQIYQQRTTVEGAAAASVLEETIARTLGLKSTEVFGLALQQAIGHSAPASAALTH